MPDSTPDITIVKGAHDVILGLCGQWLESAEALALSQDQRRFILEQNRDMGSPAQRALAAAHRQRPQIRIAVASPGKPWGSQSPRG